MSGAAMVRAGPWRVRPDSPHLGADRRVPFTDTLAAARRSRRWSQLAVGCSVVKETYHQACRRDPARVAELADAEGLNPSAPSGGVRVRTPPRARRRVRASLAGAVADP